MLTPIPYRKTAIPPRVPGGLLPLIQSAAAPPPKYTPPPSTRPSGSSGNPFAQMITPVAAPPPYPGSAPPTGGYDGSGINPGGLYDPSRAVPPPPVSEPPPAPAPLVADPNDPTAQAQKTRAVGPGPTGTDVYATRAAELNSASSRWHGNITENDVRAFDQYAASYRERGGVGTPEIWDWLAAGRPQTKGDYYDDKAVEYNFHARTKGLYYGVITRDDVVALHRFNEAQAAAGKPGMEPVEWLTAGKPTTVWDGVTRPGMPNMDGAWRSPADLAVGSGGGVRGGPPPPPPPPPTPPVPGANSAPVPPVAPSPVAPSPPAATPPPDGAAPPPYSAPQTGTGVNDILARTIAEVEARYDPSFRRNREDLQQRLMQTGAITGAVNSGGFTDVVGDEMVNLISQQQAQLGQEISAQTINATQLAMQKYVAELNDSFSRLQLQTNSDLERKAQELQKYGIDQTVFMDKYKADLALKGIQYSSNAQVNAASMQAAASQAAAAAAADASRYATDMRYRTDLFQGDVTRERNIMDYILGLGAINKDWMDLFLAADPFGFLTGNTPPGQVIVNP